MESPGLDLNLVVVLHALLHERNVTRAGERVGLSQSGSSGALARLRRHFNDPLLVRTGNTYELTPLAQSLYHQIGGAIEQLEWILKAQPVFDPGSTDRRFLVCCSDSTLSILGSRIVAAVTKSAPGASLDFRSPDRFDHHRPRGRAQGHRCPHSAAWSVPCAGAGVGRSLPHPLGVRGMDGQHNREWHFDARGDVQRTVGDAAPAADDDIAH
ncbi:LysR family transcriptional regulator [Streptomyces luteogriseus]|uniref:LysR family transcriptional regulator n=1 Tax=Streptomyces luteogriseus TaxID=68233 RepID=UPI0037B81640